MCLPALCIRQVLTAKGAILEVSLDACALVPINLIRHITGQSFVRDVFVFRHAS